MREAPGKPRRSTVRRLREEEIALWREVAKSVARRRGAVLPAGPEAAPAPKPSSAAASLPAASPTPSPARPPSPPPLVPIERNVKRNLSRGRIDADAALDLHGLNQAEAHHALRGFLVGAQSRGARLVIVVTGKGGRGAASATSWIDEPGVLRRLVPHWLREADLRPVVLGFEEAARMHGGAGALYVRLRRRGRP